MTAIFEIYENGDPYSKTWDCSQSDDGGKSWFFRGDLGHTYRKTALIRYLRRTYPGCRIKNRY